MCTYLCALPIVSCVSWLICILLKAGFSMFGGNEVSILRWVVPFAAIISIASSWSKSLFINTASYSFSLTWLKAQFRGLEAKLTQTVLTSAMMFMLYEKIAVWISAIFSIWFYSSFCFCIVHLLCMITIVQHSSVQAFFVIVCFLTDMSLWLLIPVTLLFCAIFPCILFTLFHLIYCQNYFFFVRHCSKWSVCSVFCSSLEMKLWK